MDQQSKDKIIWSLIRRLQHVYLREVLPDFDYVYIAGNCLNPETPKDYDIFPVRSEGFKESDIKAGQVVAKTANAITLNYKGKTIQLCSYYHDSLRKLVESFDFSHIQIGVKYQLSTGLIEELYFSDLYIESRLLGASYFTGTEFPLASLFRLNKYLNRGTKIAATETIAILTNIIERGFTDYDDFKKQIDTVDLALLDPEELNSDVVYKFYQLLTKASREG